MKHMQTLRSPDNLTNEDKARLILDFFHRSMMHHAMWFARVQQELGTEKACKIMEAAWDSASAIQLKRLSNVLDFELSDGLPAPLVHLPHEKQDALLEALALNWLAVDGVWFQAVECSEGMAMAKQCNDTCWGHFSPFEAWSVKKLLNMDEHPGLDGLKQALRFRLYSFINKQSITDETDSSFVFRMNDCRVQSARKRKELDDYPCKSGGTVEFTEFACAIDSRIKTECIGCPPDPHPEEWYCAWKFSMGEKHT
jgi:hypothetical protein